MKTHLLLAAASNVFDPVGNEWAVGTPHWYYWSGFAVGCGFIVFALIKRLARRSVGSSADF